MRSSFSATQLAFAEQVKDLLAACKLPHGVHVNPWQYAQFRHALAACGWLAPRWPARYGGTGWSPSEQELFYAHVCDTYPAYQEPGVIALLGGVLPHIEAIPGMETWQLEDLLPELLTRARTTHCAVFEPEAGIDLQDWETELRLINHKYLLSGTKRIFEWADDATTLVVFARCLFQQKRCISGIVLKRDTPGVSMLAPVGTAGICDITLDNVAIDADMPGFFVPQEVFLATVEEAYLEAPGQAARMNRLLTELDALMTHFELIDELGASRDEVAQDIAAYTAMVVRRRGLAEPDQYPPPWLARKAVSIEENLHEILTRSFGYYALPIADDLLSHNEGPVGPPGKGVADVAEKIQALRRLGLAREVQLGYQRLICEAQALKDSDNAE